MKKAAKRSRKTTSKLIMLSCEEDVYSAFADEAEEAGQPLATWCKQRIISTLPDKVRSNLKPLNPPHRPKRVKTA